jgi:quinol monooxygenase YgiN
LAPTDYIFSMSKISIIAKLTAADYYFFEIYSDADAKAEHGKGDGMRSAMGAFAGLLAARPEVITMRPIVDNRLNL